VQGNAGASSGPAVARVIGGRGCAVPFAVRDQSLGAPALLAPGIVHIRAMPVNS